MELRERIKLRDEILELLKKYSIITLTNRGWYRIINRKRFDDIVSNNEDIKDKYIKYISDFRTNEEGVWNLLHISDYSKYICPYCNDGIKVFYDCEHGYRNTCGSKECAIKAREFFAKNTINVNFNNSNKPIKVTNISITTNTSSNSSKSKEVKGSNKDDETVNTIEYTNIETKIKNLNANIYGQNYSLENTYDSSISNLPRYIKNFIKSNTISSDDIWNSDEKFKEFFISKYNEHKEPIILNSITNPFNVNLYTVRSRINALGLSNYFNNDDNEEMMFDIFKDFLVDNNITNYRLRYKFDSTTEFDVFLEDYAVAFQLNDINNHNCIKNKDKYYHLNMSLRAKENNIRLIHLWEWELKLKSECDRVFKWIINNIKDDNFVHIKDNYTIKEVPLEEEKIFLNSYHLQGYIKSEYCLGIYYEDTLIQLISFGKPRFNKNYECELLRLCTRYGYSFVNGFNRLLSYFIKTKTPKSIISYCNLDKFTGKVYEDLGFKLKSIGDPQVTWCNKNMKRFYQSSLNRLGADKLLKVNYGKGTDNESIVLAYGYQPIYNCGLAVYIWHNKNIKE